jgi:putative glycerol-1-phosphate prenyltransferase
MKQALYHQFVEKKRQGKKSFVVLVDPDKVDAPKIQELVQLAVSAKVDYFFVGGSLVISNHLDECIQQIKASCSIPLRN